MNLNLLAKTIQKAIRDNSPVILTAVGVSGTITTAYLAGRATWKAFERLEVYPPGQIVNGEFHKDSLTNREKLELVWDLYIPPVTSGILTVGAIIGSNHISSKRAAAAYSVLAVTERTLSEYREQVIEQVGAKKEQAIRDEIAQRKVAENPPGQLIVTGAGTVLCCELYTGRYFHSDMEKLRKAQNDINMKLVNQMYATLNDFYWIMELPQTSDSGGVGWDSSRLLELEFSTVLSDDSRPCIAFEYNYIKPL